MLAQIARQRAYPTGWEMARDRFAASVQRAIAAPPDRRHHGRSAVRCSARHCAVR